MRFLSRAIGGLALIALSAALLFWGATPYLGCAPTFAAYGFGCAVKGSGGGGAAAAPQERVFETRVVLLERIDAQPVITAFGEVRSGRTLEIYASAAGELVSIDPSFTDGAKVRAGAVLFEVDPADAVSARLDAEAALAEAEAELAEAEQAVGLAEAEYQSALGQQRLQIAALERRRELGGSGFASRQDIEAAELAVADAERAVITRDQARAAAARRLAQATQQRLRAEIALEEAARDVSDTKFRAPFDGWLDGVDATLGRLVAVNERLGALIDPSALEVGFRVSDADFARMLDEAGALAPLDAVVVLQLGVRRMEMSAQLDRPAARVDMAEGGRLVYARLLGAEALAAGAVFRPGDFVEVRVREPRLEAAAAIPAAAIDGRGRILVLDSENRLEEVEVELARRQGDLVLVRGAPFGREIVAARQPQLGSGVLVRPLRRAGEAAPDAAVGDAQRVERAP